MSDNQNSNKNLKDNFKPTIPKGARHHHFWIEDNILYESYTTIRGLRYCFKMALEEGQYADNENVDGYLEECIAKEYFHE